jgi:hypothetical protein
MLLAGFAQIPLSITNAVIATAALIRDYFPDKPVSERRLMLNMGFMNIIPAFLAVCQCAMVQVAWLVSTISAPVPGARIFWKV